MRVAQICNKKVHWIFETDETMDQLKARFAPDMVFTDITDKSEVQEGWDYEGDKFIEPSIPILSIDEQILALELQQTPRMYREATLDSKVTNPNWKNDDGTFRTAVQQLQWLDQQIAVLRQKKVAG
jgi:hypothetical protein